MQRIIEKFFTNCREKGYSEEVTKRYGDRLNLLQDIHSQRLILHHMPLKVSRVFISKHIIRLSSW